MLLPLWLGLAQIAGTSGDNPDTLAPPSKPSLRFSDLRTGLRQVNDNGASDHTYLYGFLLTIALVVLVVILVRLFEQTRMGGQLAAKTPALVPAPPKNLRIMCPNSKCRSMLIVPELARGKIVKCSKCKRLVKVPLLPPPPVPHRFGEKHIRHPSDPAVEHPALPLF